MEENSISLGRIVRLAGAFVACAIGSGFATGQEVLQFFTAHGAGSIAGSLITTMIFAWCGMVFMKHGFAHRLDTPAGTLSFYFGQKAGRAAELLIQLFLYGVYIIMVAGAGATIREYYGLPAVAGCLLVALLTLLTVLLGLSRLTDILGGLGPVIIVFALITGLYGVLDRSQGPAEAAELVPLLQLTKAPGGWLGSAILYPAFNAVVVIFLSCCIGSEAKSRREAALGGLLGGFLFGAAVCLMNLALLGNIGELYDCAVPTLELAKRLSPAFAAVFSVIICLGIYTTAVPMLWGVVRHLAEDRTRKSAGIAAVLTLLGLALGTTDFKRLVNLIYPFSGYAGIILLLAAARRELIGRKQE